MASSDEAMLSAKERAALADIEARAAADDPRWADHFRGARVRRRARGGLPDAAWLMTAVGHAWASIRPGLWGPVLLVVGLAMAVVGLIVSLVVGVTGVLITTSGLALLGELVRGRAVAEVPAEREQAGATDAG